VVLIGYSTGLEGILARLDEATLKGIAQAVGNNTEGLVQELARRRLIRPLVTQAISAFQCQRKGDRGALMPGSDMKRIAI